MRNVCFIILLDQKDYKRMKITLKNLSNLFYLYKQGRKNIGNTTKCCQQQFSFGGGVTDNFIFLLYSFHYFCFL